MEQAHCRRKKRGKDSEGCADRDADFSTESSRAEETSRVHCR